MAGLVWVTDIRCFYCCVVTADWCYLKKSLIYPWVLSEKPLEEETNLLWSPWNCTQPIASCYESSKVIELVRIYGTHSRLASFLPQVAFWKVPKDEHVIFEISPVSRPYRVPVVIRVDVNQLTGATNVRLEIGESAAFFDSEGLINTFVGSLERCAEHWARKKKERENLRDELEYEGALEYVKPADLCWPVL